MFGYKAFILTDGKLTTMYGDRKLIYEIGQTYELNDKLEMYKTGYHYCENLEYVYDYYPYNSVIVKVEISQDAQIHMDDTKNCTNKIKLIELMEGEYKTNDYKYYDLYGNLRKTDGPISYELYYLHGQLHNINRPSRIKYYSNGQIEYEEYRYNGRLHRLDGPAYIKYYLNGNKLFEQYYENGRQHCLDGPAWIGYDQNGHIKYEAYFENGVKK